MNGKLSWLLRAALGAAALVLGILAFRQGTAESAQVDAGGLPDNADEVVFDAVSYAQTDMRLPSPEMVKRAAAKLAIACADRDDGLLGEKISVTLGLAGVTSPLSETLASELACALDAPPEASCDLLKACESGIDSEKLPQPICLGPAAIADRDFRFANNCRLFGSTCFETPLGAACGLGPCAPGETYSCEGNLMVSCVQGVRVAQPCGAGQRCVQECSGVVECRGEGPACSGQDRCDGNVAVACVPDAFGQGHEVRRDCTPWGLECQLLEIEGKVPLAKCTPSVEQECDPATAKARCVKGALEVCLAGRFEQISCHDLGFDGCSKHGGVQGEATCTQGPPCDVEPKSLGCCQDLATCPGVRQFSIFASRTLEIGERASIVDIYEQPATVVNAGHKKTELGASSRVGSVFSRASVFAAEGTTIAGDVRTAGELFQGDNVTITGSVIREALSFPPLRFLVPFRGPPGDDHILEPDTTELLPPGAYRKILVKPGARLIVDSGTYYIRRLETEPGGTVEFRSSLGPTFIYVQLSFTHRGSFVDDLGRSGNVLVASVSPHDVLVEGAFLGTLVAPKAHVRLEVAPVPHRGAFYARHLHIGDDVRIEVSPFPLQWNDGVVGRQHPRRPHHRTHPRGGSKKDHASERRGRQGRSRRNH